MLFIYQIHMQYMYVLDVFILHLPTTTVYPSGFLFRATQWAAVTTQSGLIRDPPQMCRPFTLREICHGHEWGWASTPPTTRAPAGREPHPITMSSVLLNTSKGNYEQQNPKTQVYTCIYILILMIHFYVILWCRKFRVLFSSLLVGCIVFLFFCQLMDSSIKHILKLRPNSSNSKRFFTFP